MRVLHCHCERSEAIPSLREGHSVRHCEVRRRTAVSSEAIPSLMEATVETKKIYESKTFWVNLVAILGLILQANTGYVMDVEAQAGLLGLINIGLRLITKHEVKLTGL